MALDLSLTHIGSAPSSLCSPDFLCRHDKERRLYHDDSGEASYAEVTDGYQLQGAREDYQTWVFADVVFVNALREEVNALGLLQEMIPAGWGKR
jgi:hypothetical protein